ncbi:hypothetical protein [Actinopolymorpha alba]|uniref:hypothetical protein n=1 Tax=Actinopolymorpha alba TaxID=533267 RepID=UPI00036089F9|nr:hypothetical protein [Actinopolymorpha alba]
MTTEVFATRAPEALEYADHTIGVTVREICRNGAGTPRQRALLAAATLEAHFTSRRVTRLIEAAEAEQEKVS